MTDTTKKFYVYVHKYASGPKIGQVFYVGKGCGGRAWSKSSRNPYWRSIVEKHGYTCEIFSRFKDEACAFSIEVALISFYGRDILCNMTDGGDGPCGYRPTDYARAVASLKMVENWADPSYRGAMVAKYNSSYTRDKKSKSIRVSQKRPSVINKLSRAGKAQWADPEMHRKMSLAMSASKGGRPFTNSAGIVFDLHIDAIKWLRINGWPKASQGNLCMALLGKRPTAYGYKWEYIK